MKVIKGVVIIVFNILILLSGGCLSFIYFTQFTWSPFFTADMTEIVIPLFCLPFAILLSIFSYIIYKAIRINMRSKYIPIFQIVACVIPVAGEQINSLPMWVSLIFSIIITVTAFIYFLLDIKEYKKVINRSVWN